MTELLSFQMKKKISKGEFVIDLCRNGPWSLITRHSLAKVKQRNEKHRKLSFYWGLTVCRSCSKCSDYLFNPP